MINLPNRKRKALYKRLSAKKHKGRSIPEQPYYRKRKQTFYWDNNIDDGEHLIHVVGCLEQYNVVDKKAGNIKPTYSEHTWISSTPLNLGNVHALCNLGARKGQLIEDNFSTEKHRGYQYQHAFSYQWAAMQGFHYLMRLGHAINVLSEFSAYLKKWIKQNGVAATLKLIKETLCSPWLPPQWYEQQAIKSPSLDWQWGVP